MRPMILTMSTFGSYADCVTIDFGQVQQGVFLITGDTGAGKTTIFDGITYALYGQTSGGRRDGTMMRSQYAPSGTKTYVDLTAGQCGTVPAGRQSVSGNQTRGQSETGGDPWGGCQTVYADRDDRAGGFSAAAAGKVR